MNAEKTILGSIILNNECLLEIADLLKPEHFTAQNENIYRAIETMYSANLPIDTVTLWEQIKKQGDSEKVSIAYISSLTSDWGIYGNELFHARVVVEGWMKRQATKSSQTMINRIDSGKDIFEIIDKQQTELNEITEVAEKKKGTSNKEIGDTTLAHIEKASKGDISSLGVKTGFRDIDDKMICLPNSDLVLVAARPSMGKTAFMNDIALNASLEDHVVIFSLEMSKMQLYIRFLVSKTGFPYHKIFSGNLNVEEKAKVYRAKQYLDNLKMHIDDSSGLSLMDVQTKARRFKKKHDTKLILIDYLQFMAGVGNSPNERIGSLTRGLKGLAKELDVPVVLLSQLNRNLEARSDKTPMLSDLRDSGAIEQDADAVIFLMRPEVYGETNINVKGSDTNTENLAKVIIAKQRNGAIGTEYLTFIKEQMLFRDYIPDDIF